MRTAIVVGAVTSAAIVSCFSKPDAPSGLTTDGSMGSGSGSGSGLGSGSGSGSGGTCISDDFSAPGGTMPCGAWGAAAGNGSVSRSSGVLLTQVTGPGQMAECVSAANVDFTHGASISNGAPASTLGDTTKFTATFPGGGSISLVITYNGAPTLSASCSGPGGFGNPVSYPPQAIYLKLAVTTGTTVAASYSTDGTTFTTMGSCSLTGSDVTKAQIRFGVTAGTGSGSTRTATWDDFKTCTTP